MSSPQTIPDGHYLDQFRRLVAYIVAATEHGLTATQKHKLQSERMHQRFALIRDMNKANARGELASEINGAVLAFRRVFGPDWVPRTDSTIGRVLASKGVTLRPL